MPAIRLMMVIVALVAGSCSETRRTINCAVPVEVVEAIDDGRRVTARAATTQTELCNASATPLTAVSHEGKVRLIEGAAARTIVQFDVEQVDALLVFQGEVDFVSGSCPPTWSALEPGACGDGGVPPSDGDVNPYAGQSNRELAELRGQLVWDRHIQAVSAGALEERLAEDVRIFEEQQRRMDAGLWPTKDYESADFKEQSNDDLVQTLVDNNDKLRELDGRTSFSDNEKTGYGWLIGAIHLLTVELVSRGALIIVPRYVLEPKTKAALEG